jgi:LacI family transcriptional regulator, galactose operon repressor
MSQTYNMRDVARLAGVSIASVSAVVNQKGTASAELTERVKKAMEALDYHPDQVARSLKSRRTQTIGMVIPDISNPFYTELMRGVETAAKGHRYSVFLCDSSDDPQIERDCLSVLFSHRVDGVILAPTGIHSAQDRPTTRRFPIVFVDRIPPQFRGLAVVTDNFSAAYYATRHLIELGHRDIAIITGRLDLSNGRDRLEGFRKAMGEARLVIRDELIQNGDFQLESGYQRGLQIFRSSDPPTAVFCCNNLMTLGLMRALAERHIACPEQVSILGFDDFDWAASFRPKLTTVSQPCLEMGKKAVDLLVRRIEFPEEGRDELLICLPAELRVRESTAPLPSCNAPFFPVAG